MVSAHGHLSQAGALSAQDSYVSGTERLQAILVDLLTGCQELWDSRSADAPTLTRGYFTLARVCARTLEDLERLARQTGYPPGAGRATRWRLAAVLDQATGNRHERLAWQRLLERGVLVRNLSRPGPLENCLRVTAGTPEENQRCVDAMRAALA